MQFGRIIACCSVALFTRFVSQADELSTAREVATNALPAFLRLESTASKPPGWNMAQVSNFEFSQPKEKFSVGEPFQTFFISSKSLLSYKPGEDVPDLIKPSKRIIFPVTKGSVVVGGIDVARINEEWKVSHFSTDGLVMQLSEAKKNFHPENGTNELFLLEIRSLNYRFIGSKNTNGEIYLRPLKQYSELDVSTNGSYPAEVILPRIVPAASRYNGLPQ